MTELTTSPHVDLKALNLIFVPERTTWFHVHALDCPCSRQIYPHVMTLARRHGGEFTTVLLIQARVPHEGTAYADALRKTSGFHHVVFDEDGRIAETLGVSTTPTGVVLRTDGTILFRGNYNAGRNCTARSNQYVRIALEGISTGRQLPNFPLIATEPRGCLRPGHEATIREDP